MKKGFSVLLFALISFPFSASAQNAGEFYQDIMVSDEFKMQDKMQNATDQAKRLLDQKPSQLINIDVPAPAADAKTTGRRPKPVEIKKAAPENLTPAPFGLLWGATILDIQDIGIRLKPIDEKDYVNSFTAGNLPKSVRGFRQVNITFGIENELWRIIAYGDLLEDDPLASRVLLEYRKYYSLLSRKYGNARQFYTPKADLNLDAQNGNIAVKTPAFDPSKDMPSDSNAKNLLADLKNGDAVLYATFENADVGAALAVNVDGDGKSYIIIDYKSLKILRQREAQTLDAL